MPDLLFEVRTRAGLTQAELARRAGTSQSAVARYESGAASPSVSTLSRLLRAAGRRLVVKSEDVGSSIDLSGRRMRRLRANRQRIHRAVRDVGASNARVFGSVARGEDTPGSDIDMLVDMDVNTRGVLPLIRLRRELESIVGEPVDVATPSLLKPEIAKHAVAEAVPL